MQERNKILTEFYLKNQRALHSRVKNRVGGQYNAEDVVQEAMCLALKYWDSFDEKRNDLGAWFNTILNNAANKFRRDEQNCGAFIEYDDAIHDVPAPCMSTSALRMSVQKLIDSKHKDMAYALDLNLMKGYSPMEIAEVSDIPFNTIKSWVRDFRVEARTKLGGV